MAEEAPPPTQDDERIARIRADADRPMSQNLSETIALSDFLRRLAAAPRVP